MRPIDADALKDKLQQHHDFWVMAWGGFSKMPISDKKRVDEITNCIAEVVNAPTIDALSEWIPCSERLPANDDWVIISILDEMGDTLYRYSDFGWYLEAAKCWIVESEQRTDVVAWMPLPKPWKGADNG